jgi:Holliday junction resolvase RusA-like endonuclease
MNSAPPLGSEGAFSVVVLRKPPSVNSLFRNPTRRDGKRAGRIKTERYLQWISSETPLLILATRRERISGRYQLILQLGRRKGSDLDNYAKAVSDLLVSTQTVSDDSLCERLVLEWADDLPSTKCRVILYGIGREASLAR